MNKKIAIVTGSRRGIGLGIAEELAKNEYHVVLSATSEVSSTKQLVEQMQKEGMSVEYIKCNIANKKHRENLFKLVLNKHKRLDVLVNNAGVAPEARCDLLESTEDDFDKLIEINLKGTFLMTQKAANIMVKGLQEGIGRYSPRIINIGSISAYTSSTSRGSYCISKAGVSMVTQLFADRLAEYGIPVFEVRPGIIMTDMISSVRAKYEKLIEEGLTPIKRFGQPKDVADCVMALCSGKLDFAVGQVINADGGFHIRRL